MQTTREESYRASQFRRAIKALQAGEDVRLDLTHQTLSTLDGASVPLTVLEVYERQPGGLWRRMPTATISMNDAETPQVLEMLAGHVKSAA